MLAPMKLDLELSTLEERNDLCDIVAWCILILRGSTQDEYSGHVVGLAKKTLMLLMDLFEFDVGFKAYIRRQVPTSVLVELDRKESSTAVIAASPTP